MTAQDGRAAKKRGYDRTPWPEAYMHGELCAWRFGGECDCALTAPNPLEVKRDAD